MNGKNLTILMSSIIIVSIVSAGYTMNLNNTIMTTGLFAKASAQQQSSNYTLSTNFIPSWIRNVTKWWSEGQTSDSDFLNVMQYLVDHNVIHVSQKPSLPFITNQNSTVEQKIDDLQTRYNALQIKYNELLQQIQNMPENQMASSKKYSDSISAVAVYPIIQSDGFFQTTAYNGTIRLDCSSHQYMSIN